MRKSLDGLWVLFKDGGVVASGADQGALYREGVERYGTYGGFVVDRAEDKHAIPLAHRVLFASR